MEIQNEPNALSVSPDSTPSPHSFASFRREGFVFGRFGLRAGWGIAAFIAIWLVASTISSIFALGATGQMARIMNARMEAQAHPHAAHPDTHILFTALFVAVNDGIPLIAMLGAGWLFARGERRSFGIYGICRNRWPDVFSGAFWGFALLSALVGLLHGMHLLVFDSRALTLAPALLYGVKWLVAFTLVGAAEEYFFRGYIQYTLMRGVWGLGQRISAAHPRPYAFWIAATFFSLVFAAMHGTNAGETHLGLTVVFLAGMTFAFALWHTGSLWWAIGFHTTWDWAQSFLYGVPDSGSISVGRLFVTHPVGNPMLSGGSDGPEGSIFVVIFLLLGAVAVRFTAKGAQPPLEQAPPGDDLPQEAPAAIS